MQAEAVGLALQLLQLAQGALDAELRGIDAVQECDGADVVNVSLPGFGGGLLITQDGYNDDLNGLDGEVNATNLKFTSWRLVAENFPGGPLKVDPEGYDPRRPSAR